MDALLSDFKLSSPVFPADRGIVHFLRREQTAQAALEILVAKGLSALPIVDPDRHNEPLGLFGVQHVVAYVVKQFNTHHTGEPREQDFLKFLSADLQFKAWNCYDFVMYCSTHFQTPPAIAMPAHLSLRDACKLIVERRAAEVIVFDPLDQNRLVNVVTASRIVEFLSAAIEELPAAQQPIGDFEHALTTSKGPIVAVLHNATVMSAFEQMIDKRANACAVLDEDRELCGNISLADIKTLGTGFERLRLLEADVDTFLKAVRDDPARPGHGRHHHNEKSGKDDDNSKERHRHHRHHHHHRHHRPLVTCCREDPLCDVLALFAYYRVSHVFVIDALGHPSGDFSTIDALGWLLHENRIERREARLSAAEEKVHPETLHELKQPLVGTKG